MSKSEPYHGESEYFEREDVQGHLKVLEVLREWDPIGVIDPGNPNNGAWDEYDSYAPTVIRMLDQSASIKVIEEWMLETATDYMGLSYVDKKRTRVCARQLVEYWKEWKA